MTRKNVSVDGMLSGPNWDTMNITMMNMAVIWWLEKIDKHLLPQVQMEYAVDLRNGIQLFQLMPRIARSVDSLLSRQHATVKVVQLKEELEQLGNRQDVLVNRINRTFKKKNPNSRAQDTCGHCVYIRKHLKANDINVDHNPRECPNKRVQVRMVEDDNNVEDEVSDDSATDGNADFQSNILTNSHFQNENVSNQMSTCHSLPKPPDINHSKLSYQPEFHVNLLTSENVHFIADKVVQRVKSSNSKSPSLPVTWNNEQLIMIIDEGAEVNCVDAAVVKRVGCQIFPTHQSASAAGKSKLNIFGTLPDNTISRSVFENVSVPINIGDALVVQDLGVDLLLGEPGKCRNKINTISDKKLISAQLDDKILHTPYFKLTSKSFYLCRAPSTTTIYPGQHYQVNCQTPRPNGRSKGPFGFGVTLKSKRPPTTHPPP